jgi:hypothetical protein
MRSIRKNGFEYHAAMRASHCAEVIAEALLNPARLLHPLAHFGRRHTVALVPEFPIRYGRDLDMKIDAVEQRPAQSIDTVVLRKGRTLPPGSTKPGGARPAIWCAMQRAATELRTEEIEAALDDAALAELRHRAEGPSSRRLHTAAHHGP